MATSLAPALASGVNAVPPDYALTCGGWSNILRLTMWKKTFKFWFVAAALAVGVAAQPGEEPTLLPVPEESLLLLRNGQVLSGQISRVGDLFYIALPEGEIRLRAADAEFACRDLEEGYQLKRATITVENAYEHLRLAQWCQQHKLFEHALEEIATARKIDPRVAAIDVMERRLRILMAPEEEAAPTSLPADGSGEFQELDRMVKEMPPRSVEYFSQTIQPMLMNNCTASGCHGPQSQTAFRLLRAPSHQPASRRLTQRNLYESLKWIDAEKPEESRLLKMALQRHGGAKAAAFGDRASQQQLAMTAWIYAVGQKPLPDAAMADKGENRGSPPLAASDGFGFDPAVKATSHVEPAGKRPTKQTGAKESAAKETSTKEPPTVVPAVAIERSGPDEPHPRQIQRGAPLPFVPVDPYDPEVFNRKHAASKESPPTKKP